MLSVGDPALLPIQDIEVPLLLGTGFECKEGALPGGVILGREIDTAPSSARG